MRTFFGIKPNEVILFLICLIVYAAIVFIWNLSGIASSNMSFIKDNAPAVISDLPPQSISKLVVTSSLYLMALAYALVSVAMSPYRERLPQIAGIGVLTFVAWVALNYWVIAGFLNSSILYGVAAVVLLIVWGGGVMRFVARLHDPMALFLVRFGLGLSLFITIVQIATVLYDVVASLIPVLPTFEWRSPVNGVPILYTLTFNAMVGAFLAGAGGNMLWRERRELALASGRKKR
jgi:hypothetical protein